MPDYYDIVEKNRTRLKNIADYKIATPSVLASLVDEQKYEVLRREGHEKNEAKFGSQNRFKRYAIDFVSTEKLLVHESEIIFEILWEKFDFASQVRPYKRDTSDLLLKIIDLVDTKRLNRKIAEKMKIDDLPMNIRESFRKLRVTKDNNETINRPKESMHIKNDEQFKKQENQSIDEEPDDDEYRTQLREFVNALIDRISCIRTIPRKTRKLIKILIEKSALDKLDQEEKAFDVEIDRAKDDEEIQLILDKYEKENQNESKVEKQRFAKYIVRNQRIAKLIKERARYRCQICGDLGFEKNKGGRYVEVHHIDELAKSGMDLPSNIICVCPNCHRIIHYGSSKEQSKLTRKIKKRPR